MLDRIGIPTVLVDSAISSSHPAVNIDDFGGAQSAARHLLELGHRQLAVIVLPPTRSQLGNTPSAARRMAGYQAALDRAGAPAPHTVTAGISVAAGTRAFESLPKQRRPTAVLAMSDMAAIGVMSAAQAAGLRVPDDLSVVGFDDLPMAAWTSPALTTDASADHREGPARRTSFNSDDQRQDGRFAVASWHQPGRSRFRVGS